MSQNISQLYKMRIKIGNRLDKLCKHYYAQCLKPQDRFRTSQSCIYFEIFQASHLITNMSPTI